MRRNGKRFIAWLLIFIMCITDMGYVQAEEVSGNGIPKVEMINQDTILGNTISENTVSENTVSENVMSQPNVGVFSNQASALKKIDYLERAKRTRVYMTEKNGCSIASIACVEAYVNGTDVTDTDNDIVYQEIKQYNKGLLSAQWPQLGYQSVKKETKLLYQELYEQLLATGLPVIVSRVGSYPHYSVVVGFEDLNGNLCPDSNEFLVMESQKYQKLYEGGEGYPTAWRDNYDTGSRIPLNIWEKHDCANGITQICYRTTGTGLTSLKDEPLVSELEVTCTKPEGELIKGNTFSISGRVQSNNRITSVSASILNSSGTIVCTKTVYPNRYNYSWGSPSEIDNEMKFKSLGVGNYSFRLIVQDEANKNKKINSTFSIVEKKDIVQNKKPTMILNSSKNTLDEISATRTAVIKNPSGAKVSEGGMILYNSENMVIDRCWESLNSYDKEVWLWYATDKKTNTNLDIKLIPGTTYFYEIYAKVGSERCSVRGEFTTLGTAKPEKPVLNCAESEFAVGDIATVTWNAVENVLGGYEITVRTVDDTYSKTINTNMTTASFELPKSGDYEISIVAKGYLNSDRGFLEKKLIVHSNCKVTFVEEKEDGSSVILKEEEVKYGRNATAPMAPSRTGWIFQGWDTPYMIVKEDTVAKAVFVRNIYTVKFVSEDESGAEKIDVKRVPYQGSALPPEISVSKPGYTFVGWDSEDYKYVTENLTIRASYIYENTNLPIQLSVNSCTYDSNDQGDGEGYTVLYDITNYNETSTRGRVVVAIKGADGRLLQTTESNAFTLRISQTKTNVEVFVPCDKDAPDVEAATAEVVIVDGYKTSIPISEKKTVNIQRSWSDWSTSVPPAGVTDVESRIEYRYRDKKTTSSDSPILEGWMYERTEGYWGAFGDWSGWSRNQYYASDSREVESTTVTDVAGYMLQEYYFYKYYRNGGWWYSYANRSGEAGVSGVEFHNIWINTSGDSRQMIFDAMDNGYERYTCSPYQFYQVEFFYKGVGQQNIAPVTHKEWRCRDRQYLYKHYFYQWSNWSEWGSSAVTPESNKEVETRTVYRYKANAAAESSVAGTVRTISGVVSPSLAGKQAILLVYKYNEPSDSNNEFLGQTTIAQDGSYTFSFITREEPSVETRDFTIKLGIEGATELLFVGTIEAPKPEYSVTFKDWNGNVISQQTVKEGEMANQPKEPKREGYRFSGWNSGLTNVHDDMEILALYEREQCSVLFVDWGTKNVKTEIYNIGDDIIYPAWKEVEGYEFKGWFNENGEEVPKAEKNLVLTAEYKVKEYRVNFYNQIGEVVSSQDIKYGEAAWAPYLPEVDGQRFSSWSTYDFSSVKRNLDVFPSYEYYETTSNPVADIKSQTLSEPIQVSLSCSDNNSVILYTLDGTTPNIFSNEYTGPITIDKNEVLQFYARSEGKNDSEIVSEAYLMQKSEDDAGALVIKKDVLNLVLDEEPPQVTYFLYHENPSMGVQFYSLNEEIVSVDKQGNLRVNNVGSTQVFAVTDDYRYADYCDIVVTSNEIKMESFDISTKKLDLVIGEEAELTTKVTPANATYQEVIWQSEDEDVVTIDEEGHLTATGKGSAYISAYSYTGSNVTFCYVNVDDISLNLSDQEITIAAGQRYQLNATLRGGEQRLTWKSNDTSVAKVSSDGLVEALAPGMATILVTAENNDFRTCAVRVTSGELAADPPEAPQVVEVTDSKIVVKEQEGCEYSLNARNWQSSNIFVGLTADTRYTVFSRVKATAGTLASSASKGTEVKTQELVIIIQDIEPQIYTGSAIKPQLVVKYSGITLEEGKDYKVTYKNNVKVSDTAPVAIVSGKGYYSGTITKQFRIVKKDISDGDIEFGELLALPNNKKQLLIPKISYGKQKLTKGRDFTITYPDANTGAYIEPGEYDVIVEGMGNYEGSKHLTMVITNQTFITKVKVKAPTASQYNSDIQHPDVTITYKGKRLLKGKDYELSYPDQSKGAYRLPGTYVIKITGIGDFVGSRNVNFKITGIPIKKATVTGLQTNMQYTGMDVTQEDIVVSLDGYGTLVEDKDYKIKYAKNHNVGKANITIVGINGYSGEIRKLFSIGAYDLALDESGLVTVNDEVSEQKYTKGGCTPDFEICFDGEELVRNVDYTIKYSNNKAVNDGTDDKKLPTAVIKGKGNFKGTITKTFIIEEQQMDEVNIKVADVLYKNNNKFFRVSPVIYDINGKKMSAGSDYEKKYVYRYADGTIIQEGEIPEVGSELMITVVGKGNYEGIASATYRVGAKMINKTKISKIKKNYTGTELYLKSGELVVKDGSKLLIEGTDFEIIEETYNRNISPGTASVYIRGLGEYVGEVKVNFTISKKLFF